MHTVSGSISLPLSGFFSPFPHGTGSLSVDNEYLALEDGPPIFRQNFSCSALLVSYLVPLMLFYVRDYHPLWLPFPEAFHYNFSYRMMAVPLSLAATCRISVDFFSYGYLDVSVLRVRFNNLCIQLLIVLMDWVPPFRYLRVIGCLPPNRSFSQATTSFIACCRQGIHRVHFLTWPYNPNLSGIISFSYLNLLALQYT